MIDNKSQISNNKSKFPMTKFVTQLDLSFVLEYRFYKCYMTKGILQDKITDKNNNLTTQININVKSVEKSFLIIFFCLMKFCYDH